LQSAIQESAAVVLLWSQSASRSRWVAAEILTAFHTDRRILSSALDDTRLPQFLDNDVKLTPARLIEDVCRAVREAPGRANAYHAMRSGLRPEVRETVQQLGRAQYREMELLDTDRAASQKAHDANETSLVGALQKWPFEPEILNLAGYHYKNAYQLTHWEEIQGGQPPPDPVLKRAEAYFIRSLFVDPNDCAALNGWGNLLIFQNELEAAEFFTRRAVAIVEQTGLDYPAPAHDLAYILRLKG
jgi:hypothetical protein